MRAIKRTLPVLVLMLASSTAIAQPAPAPTPTSAQPADQAYSRGRAHYDLREWDKAIAEFKEAYRLRPDAPSLFNIAQSYRLKGDCVQALSFYKTYRRNFPGEKNIARVDQFIAEMEECAKKAPPPSTTTTTQPPASDTSSTNPTETTQPSTDPTQQPPTTTPPAGTAPPPTGTTQMSPSNVAPPIDISGGPDRRLAISGLATGGVGVACVIGGVFAAMRARSIEQDIQDVPRWDPALHEKGENADLLAKVLFGVGGAAIIGGGVLVWMGYRSERAPATTALRVVPRSDGAMVFWSGGL